jgi:hypothetical protein
MKADPSASLRFGAGLRYLTSSGFDTARKGVMLSGQAATLRVTVLIRRDAIEEVFPSIATSGECTAFVERNLGALRDVVQSKLVSGRFAEGKGRLEGDLQIEVRTNDLLRAQRWMTP